MTISAVAVAAMSMLFDNQEEDRRLSVQILIQGTSNQVCKCHKFQVQGYSQKNEELKYIPRSDLCPKMHWDLLYSLTAGRKQATQVAKDIFPC